MPRARPVLPNEQRSQCDIARTYEVTMQRILTILTHEEQARLRPVRRRGKATTRASLAGMVGIDFHGQATRSAGFVGDVAMQFSEGPRRSVAVGLALLPALPVWLARLDEASVRGAPAVG